MIAQQLIHHLVILGGSCRTDGERQRSQIQFKEPVALCRLGVIVLLWCGPRNDLDLARIETKAFIDVFYLRFDGAIIGQKNTRGAAFDNGGCDRTRSNIG
jgi:hypothetical protein